MRRKEGGRYFKTTSVKFLNTWTIFQRHLGRNGVGERSEDIVCKVLGALNSRVFSDVAFYGNVRLLFDMLLHAIRLTAMRHILLQTCTAFCCTFIPLILIVTNGNRIAPKK